MLLKKLSTPGTLLFFTQQSCHKIFKIWNWGGGHCWLLRPSSINGYQVSWKLPRISSWISSWISTWISSWSSSWKLSGIFLEKHLEPPPLENGWNYFIMNFHWMMIYTFYRKRARLSHSFGRLVFMKSHPLPRFLGGRFDGNPDHVLPTSSIHLFSSFPLSCGDGMLCLFTECTNITEEVIG